MSSTDLGRNNTMLEVDRNQRQRESMNIYKLEQITFFLGKAIPILGDHVASDSVWMTYEKNALEKSFQSGHYVYGFQNSMKLYDVYCVEMAKHKTKYPEIKEKICTKQTD